MNPFLESYELLGWVVDKGNLHSVITGFTYFGMQSDREPRNSNLGNQAEKFKMPSVQNSDAETPSLESDMNHAHSNGVNGVNGAHKTNGANGLPPRRIRCIIIGAGCVKSSILPT